MKTWFPSLVPAHLGAFCPYEGIKLYCGTHLLSNPPSHSQKKILCRICTLVGGPVYTMVDLVDWNPRDCHQLAERGWASQPLCGEGWILPGLPFHTNPSGVGLGTREIYQLDPNPKQTAFTET